MSSGGFDLGAIRAGLADAVDAVERIKRVYPYIADSIEDTPAAYIGMADPALYNRTFAKGAVEATIPVTLVLGRVNQQRSQELLDDLVSWPGPVEPSSSVKAAIEADRTLGGACDTLTVERAHHIRAVTIGKTDYIAVDLVVIVHTSARRRRVSESPDS